MPAVALKKILWDFGVVCLNAPSNDKRRSESLVLVIMFGFASFFLGGFFSTIFFLLSQKKRCTFSAYFFY